MEDRHDPAEPTADDQLRADEALRILGEDTEKNRADSSSPARAFVNWLPVQGQRNSIGDICAYINDSCGLRQRRNFLVDAVLKPSKFLLPTLFRARIDRGADNYRGIEN